MPTFTKHSTVDLPEVFPKIIVECAGPGFLEFRSLWENQDQVWEDALAGDRAGNNDENEDDDNDIDDVPGEESSLPAVDLFSLTELELKEIDYYQVLHLPFRPTLTSDDVKKAYRKACLKYHPDKSGRGEEDAVFLKVKAAFETLSTQKLAYDSTEMPFDDGLPSENPKDFFAEYGAVFERNLHFDARLLPPKQSNAMKKRNKNIKSAKFHPKKPPSLGDPDTPIDKVHEFYDYWTHFESWRDFTIQASRELETEDHLENAESRYEKRWYQKEIDRHAKKLKQLEVARITTLVERAMAVDPRLMQERKRMIEEKEERQRKREQEALEREMAKEEARKADEKRMEEEKQRRADEKLQREKEKKQLRKVKQAFRRQVSGALEELLEKEHALEDEVDLICNTLNRTQLSELNLQLDAKSAPDIVSLVKKHSQELQNGSKDQSENDQDISISNGSTTITTETTITKKESSGKSAATTKIKAPFTKEELSALAKGIKKYPPGGANRWDQIANYINNLCRPDDPRTKEECIETFNRLNNNKTNKVVRNGNDNNPAPTPAAIPAESSSLEQANGDGDWTPEQDQQLQTALSSYPATMEKNERWTMIAKGVKGKSKKECVQRFKDIRNAIKGAQKS
ncbi:chaperone protein [Nitzschia inconspicua]|uniref:Chaperone protein n=1 Tax=Nitzschia inconspicua TaxID=303405 RepID=A0A9K3PJ05_9STRA|nr:chaperone protein [Nitzschia inconspicua]